MADRLVAHAYLENCNTAVYQTSAGMQGHAKLFKHFLGIPSHVARSRPPGGELGYALSHAYGAAFET